LQTTETEQIHTSSDPKPQLFIETNLTAIPKRKSHLF